MVEHDLAKVGVEGSNPFARSSFLIRLKSDDEPAHSAGFLFLDQTRGEPLRERKKYYFETKWPIGIFSRFIFA